MDDLIFIFGLTCFGSGAVLVGYTIIDAVFKLISQKPLSLKAFHLSMTLGSLLILLSVLLLAPYDLN